MEEHRTAMLMLNGTNYQVWKFKTELLLVKEGLWDTVSEEVPATKSEDWKKLDGRAKATIGLLVENSQVIHIKNLGHAHEYWESLKAIHEKASLGNIVILYKKLWKSHILNKSMESHIMEVMCVVDELRSLGETVTDKNVIGILLGSLSDEYEPLISGLEARSDADLSLNVVKEKLLQCYQRMNADSSDVHQGLKVTKENKERKIFRCYGCGKEGHARRYCPQNKQAKLVSEEAIQSAQCLSAMEYTVMDGNWYIDSGATSHMTNNKDLLEQLCSKEVENIKIADGRSVKCNAEGSFITQDFRLDNVLYVPELDSNLISVSALSEAGFEINFKRNVCEIYKSDAKIMTIKCLNGLYKVQPKSYAQFVSNGNVQRECIHVWHRRFGHRNYVDLKRMIDGNHISGVEIKSCNCPDSGVCGICCEGKLSRQKFPKRSEHGAENMLDLVHSDLCGPLEVATPSGNRYVLTLIDDYSRFCFVYFLKRKSETVSRIKEFSALVKNTFNKNLKRFRSDRGGEYIAESMSEFFKSEGIIHEKSIPGCPQQNGTAERKNRYLLEMARCLLFQSNLDKKYWAEAINAANYIENRLGVKHNDNVTPYERWYGRKPNLNYFRTFGCKAYVYCNDPRRKKLDRKSQQLIFVGYEEHSKGYRFLDNRTNSVVVSRDVRFDEFSSTNYCSPTVNESIQYIRLFPEDNDGCISEAVEINVNNHEEQNEDVFEDALENFETDNEVVRDQDVTDERIESNQEETGEQIHINEEQMNPPRISSRCNKGVPPIRFQHQANKVSKDNDVIPESFSIAVNCAEKELWKEAITKELNSLKKNETWDIVDRPKNVKTVSSKWIFNIKRNPDGSVDKYKARLVAKGYLQKYKVDYFETYSPVVRMSSIRLLISLAVKFNLLVHHMDVTTAYLNGILHNDVYMKIPEGVEVNETNKVCKLSKSLYGLKQSGREWNIKLDEVLQKIGFKRCQTDACVYVRNEGGELNIIAVYVDDLLIVCSTELSLNKIKGQISSEFTMVDKGDCKYFLGIEIKQTEEGISMNQEKFVGELLDTYQMSSCKNTYIPLNPGIKLDKCDECTDQCKKIDGPTYQSLIGSLMYLAISTRPDIMHSVSKLAQFNSNPHEVHWNAAKHLLKYLKFTKDFALFYKRERCKEFKGFVDADWGSDSWDRKSYSGFVFMMGDGSPISWESKKQSCIALSSTEAEYIAMCNATKEAVYLLRLLEEIGANEKYPVMIYNDNQSAQQLIRNQVYHSRSKHIDLRYHYVRDMFNQGLVQFAYQQTDEMCADILTKSLSKVKHCKFRNMIGLREGVGV